MIGKEEMVLFLHILVSFEETVICVQTLLKLWRNKLNTMFL